MKLYFGGLSPFVRKVMIAAHELGARDKIETEKAMVTPFKTNDEVAAVNPLGKIPAAVLEDGTSLYGSSVICEYLDAKYGQETLFLLTIPAGRHCVWQLWAMASLKQAIWPGSRHFALRAPNGKTGRSSKWAKSSALSLPLRRV